jgi:glutamate-1-semialdehyde 2,1-aminomutase
MRAGLTMLEEISKPGFFNALTTQTARLLAGLQAVADETGHSMTTNQVGGMFGIFFSNEPKITSYAQVMACDIPKFNRFFHGMLHEGIYLAPSAFEAGFVSSAHTDADIDNSIAAARRVLLSL